MFMKAGYTRSNVKVRDYCCYYFDYAAQILKHMYQTSLPVKIGLGVFKIHIQGFQPGNRYEKAATHSR